MSLLRERVTGVWLGLMALTVLTTWVLSKNLVSPAVAVTGTFLIAAMKVRFVMLDFMGCGCPGSGPDGLPGVDRRRDRPDPGLLVPHHGERLKPLKPLKPLKERFIRDDHR